MVVLGLMGMIIFLKGKDILCCGAVPGSAILTTAVLRTATTALGRCATTPTTLLVFVLPVGLGELFSSSLYLVSLPFILVPFYVFVAFRQQWWVRSLPILYSSLFESFYLTNFPILPKSPQQLLLIGANSALLHPKLDLS